jgi:LysM repeat protein
MDHSAQRRPVLHCFVTAGLLLLLLLLISPQRTHAQDGGLSEAAQAVAAAINQARADAGVPSLAVNPLLNQAAQGHVDDMIANYVYGHYGSDGSSVQMRVARTGYSQSPWVSENWVSSTSVAGAMGWWMNDYVHRVNILNGNWTELGVGVGSRGGEMIFVTVFSAGTGGEVQVAVPAAGAPAPAPEQPPVEAPAAPLHVPPEGLDYTIQPGDTLLMIALRYGLVWQDIAAANGLGDRSLLQIGQVIRLPGEGGTEPAAAAPAVPVETTPYTVTAGDTLFSIAAHAGVTWQEVAAANGFDENDLLQIDQVIQVPKRVAEAEEAAEEQAAAPLVASAEGAAVKAAKADSSPAAKANAAPESAAPVAVASAASVAAVAEAPPADAPPAGPPGVYDVLYTVRDGDTVISIALAHDVDWQAMLALNGLDDDSLLQPGQTLRLR